MRLVKIALPVPLPQTFDYVLPDNLSVQIGCRVKVPFGQQVRIGLVVDYQQNSTIPRHQLKTIKEVLDEKPLFPSQYWQWLIWASSYYHYPLGEVLFQALPVKLRQGEQAVQTLEAFWSITPKGKNALAQDLLKKAPKQREVLTYIQQHQPLPVYPVSLSRATLQTLLGKNWIQQEQRSFSPWQIHLNHDWLNCANKPSQLNLQQIQAVEQLTQHTHFQVSLLQGVTGSGKTEVYLHSIETVLSRGKSVLVLVPEIGLTPQTIHRFQQRFNLPIEILHSHLNDTLRLQSWLKAQLGQTAIVLGTRSALFTPLPDLGMIVIDEEHDQSFKQQDNWRYHARDLAVVLAKKLDIPLILGSATPSFESLYNVLQGKYQKVSLTQQAVANHQPIRQILNLKHSPMQGGLGLELIQQMQVHLEQGYQVMLFLNRRGYAPILLCHDCGWIAECHLCDKPFTYHQKQHRLRCHHCLTQTAIPVQCKVCGSTHLITTGIGTEQLESHLKQIFPNYMISRIDRDNIRRKGSLEQELKQINQGKTQILIGTQMLAKGHDFPNVTLVALVNIDGALFSQDFRAEEKLAQLYTQVAGRAGRGRIQGTVILQTHYPEHKIWEDLLAHGYNEFALNSLKMRQQLQLPPYSAQAVFRTQSKVSQQAEQKLHHVYELFQKLSQNRPHFKELNLLGPYPANHSKKAGWYRWHLLIQHNNKALLQHCLNQFYIAYQEKSGSTLPLNLDVDPIDII